nr:unnamed protein product [Digitaria exilis]
MCARSRRRDWAKLPPDLAADIAGRLLGIDLTEYIRFRAVCKAWRQSTEDPRRLHSRFLPRNWVVLYLNQDQFRCDYGDETPRFRLLNRVTGALLTDLEFPELSGHHAMGYAKGLIVLRNTTTSGIRLLNPFTRSVTDLPDFSSILVEASTTKLGKPHRLRGFGARGTALGSR